jgi:hypothetical protein
VTKAGAVRSICRRLVAAFHERSFTNSIAMNGRTATAGPPIILGDVMPTQREINAGTAMLIRLREENVPWILRSKITDQHCQEMAIAVLTAAEQARVIVANNK